jgi:hypothetical protein
VEAADRPFLKMRNRCGPFKSAYAENMLNQMQIINMLKSRRDGNLLNPDDLDCYQEKPWKPSLIVKESIEDPEIKERLAMKRRDHNGVGGEDKHVYGAY